MSWIESNSNTIKIIVCILFLLKGFGIIFLNYSFWDYVFVLLLFILGFKAVSFNEKYSKLILLYIFFLLLSCIYSWMYNEQRFYIVFFHSYTYLSIFFYFYLLNTKASSNSIEKVIEYVSIIFCLCYLLQYYIYPIIIFSGAEDETNITKYTYRMRMPGSICCYTLLLYGINKFLVQKKIIYVAYCILAMYVIIIQGFRSLVSLTILAVVLMIPFVTKKITLSIIIWITIGGAFFYALNNISLFQEKYEEMMRRTDKQQTFSNQDYIRWLSLDYYWNYQFSSPVEKIVGGGNPVDKTSEYYRDIEHAINFYGYYWVDLGIIGLSMVIGTPATLILIIIYILIMIGVKDTKYQYIRFTLFTVLAGSIFTSMELFRQGNILLLSLFMYMEYILKKEKKTIQLLS